MEIEKTYFYSPRNEMSEQKKIMDDFYQLLPSLDPCSRGFKENKDLIEQHGFELGWKIPLDGIDTELNAYHKEYKIGLKVQKAEQIDVRSDLLFMEIGHQKGYLASCFYILPFRRRNANFKRVVNELTQTEVFSKFFPIELPMFLIGYQT